MDGLMALGHLWSEASTKNQNNVIIKLKVFHNEMESSL